MHPPLILSLSKDERVEGQGRQHLAAPAAVRLGQNGRQVLRPVDVESQRGERQYQEWQPARSCLLLVSG